MPRLVVTPWADPAELLAVREQLYDPEARSRRAAVDLVRIPLALPTPCRCPVPLPLAQLLTSSGRVMTRRIDGWMRGLMKVLTVRFSPLGSHLETARRHSTRA